MNSWCVHFCLATAFCCLSSGNFLHAADGLVHNEVANRHGLQRAWFAQVRVDRAKHRVANWTLDRDQLFAITTDGTVQAINAETGATLWVSAVSSQNASTAGMAVNSDVVAVLSATRLHLMDRRDGRMISHRILGGSPSPSPALSNRIAYVALHSGRIEGFELHPPYSLVWQYQSAGRCFLSPTATGKVVSWPTTGGLLYVASAENPRPLFRIRTNDEIVAPPAEQQPYLFVASLDGYLYCFHELTGMEQWRYSTGFAVTNKPAIVGNMAFVASLEPALHAVDGASGKKLWQAEGIDQFAAVSSNYAYGMDRYGELYVLEKESGSTVGRIPTSPGMSAVVNDQSDRVFLVNPQGLVQCLREIGANEPTWYRQAEQDEQAEQPTEDTTGPFVDAASTTEPAEPAADAGPFEAEEPTEAADEDNPFFFE
ncbi:MAG: PQQ-binding-like beta-propeller repeat protein [Pirellulales bacterium]|nr:PQQ-binding-like beta-propeller repeat protein [Pirellulales bacterium]